MSGEILRPDGAYAHAHRARFGGTLLLRGTHTLEGLVGLSASACAAHARAAEAAGGNGTSEGISAGVAHGRRAKAAGDASRAEEDAAADGRWLANAPAANVQADVARACTDVAAARALVLARARALGVLVCYDDPSVPSMATLNVSIVAREPPADDDDANAAGEEEEGGELTTATAHFDRAGRIDCVPHARLDAHEAYTE